METILILLAGVTLAAFILNLPFGYLRAPVRKFSFWWFFYIHAPIPAIFILRTQAGLPKKIIPILFASAILGQVIGARINPKKIKKQSKSSDDNRPDAGESARTNETQD